MARMGRSRTSLSDLRSGRSTPPRCSPSSSRSEPREVGPRTAAAAAESTPQRRGSTGSQVPCPRKRGRELLPLGLEAPWWIAHLVTLPGPLPVLALFVTGAALFIAAVRWWRPEVALRDALFYLALTAAFFAQPLFTRAIQAPTDIAYELLPWREALREPVEVRNRLLWDTLVEQVPFHTLVRQRRWGADTGLRGRQRLPRLPGLSRHAPGPPRLQSPRLDPWAPARQPGPLRHRGRHAGYCHQAPIKPAITICPDVRSRGVRRAQLEGHRCGDAPALIGPAS